jgi:phenylacetate-CoA ligase
MTDDSATGPDESNWGSWIERASRDQIRSVQRRKLADLSSWVYANSEFWRRKFESEEVGPEMVSRVEDMREVPTADKSDYREAQDEAPPYGGLLCRPEVDIYKEGAFVWETSGTTGRPLEFLCSQAEYRRVDVAATRRILWTAGVRPGDIVAMCWPLTLWAVGHGIVDAARSMNVTVLPLGPSYSSEYRIQKIASYAPDVVMTTPTYSLRLAEVAASEEVALSEVGTDRLIVSGEPLPEATREEVRSRWSVDHVFDYYGLSEAFNCRMIECEHHDGMHVLEDLYLCRVVEPDGVDPVDEGERGELVVTALEQRDIATGYHFRTGDIVTYTDERCPCGRTTRRIDTLARKDDMRTIRGVNVFPQAIESIVRDHDGLNDEFRLVHQRNGTLDGLKILAEAAPEADGATATEAVRSRIEHALGDLSVEVELVDTGALERFDFKADRWIDERGAGPASDS